MIVCKSTTELETMHQAGLIVWEVLNELRMMVAAGCFHAGSGSHRGEALERARCASGVQGLPGLSGGSVRFD